MNGQTGVRAVRWLMAVMTLLGAAEGLADGEQGQFEAPAVLEAWTAEVAPGRCELVKGRPKLAADGTFHCAGMPFSVRLPVTAGVEQHYGNRFLSLQYVGQEGIVLVSTTVAIADLSRLTQKKYRATLPGYAERLLRSLGVDRVEMSAPRVLEIRGADYAIEQTVSTGPAAQPVEGTSRVMLIRGWMVHMMISGRTDQQFHRAGDTARRFIDSLEILDAEPRWRKHRYPDGATVLIPADAWEAGGGSTPHYFVPSMQGMLRFESGMGKGRACEPLNERQWMQVAGSISPQQDDPLLRFVSSRWITVAGTKMLWVEAENRTQEDLRDNLPFKPAVVIDACSDGLFHRVYVMTLTGSLLHVRRHAERIATSYRAK